MCKWCDYTEYNDRWLFLPSFNALSFSLFHLTSQCVRNNTQHFMITNFLSARFYQYFQRLLFIEISGWALFLFCFLSARSIQNQNESEKRRQISNMHFKTIVDGSVFFHVVCLVFFSLPFSLTDNILLLCCVWLDSNAFCKENIKEMKKKTTTTNYKKRQQYFLWFHM